MDCIELPNDLESGSPGANKLGLVHIRQVTVLAKVCLDVVELVLGQLDLLELLSPLVVISLRLLVVGSLGDLLAHNEHREILAVVDVPELDLVPQLKFMIILLSMNTTDPFRLGS